MACEPPDDLHRDGVGTDGTGAHLRTALTRTVLLNGMETVSIIGSRHVPRRVDDRARRAYAE